MIDSPAPQIDCHAHIYTRAMPLAPGAWHHPPGDATVDQFLAAMADRGVTHGVLAAASLYGDYNDYSLAATSAHANLRTTVIVRPGIAFDDLERMDAAGAVGIRLQLRNRPLPDLASPEYRQLLANVARLGWHVELHDDLQRLPPMIAAIERAGVPLVVDHFGRPEGLEAVVGGAFQALLKSVARGRTWVKVASGFRLECQAAVRAAFDRLLDTGGPERLMWGSDWPFAGFETVTDYGREIEAYRTLTQDPALRDAIDRTGMAFFFAG